MHVKHVLFTRPQGGARGDAVRLLNNSSIRFIEVEWADADPDRSQEDLCLVTPVGEFATLDGIRFYAAHHQELANALHRAARSA